MDVPASFPAFNTPLALQKSALLPVRTNVNGFPLTCSNCQFINPAQHNFCTNCSYPLYPNKDRLALYHYRLSKRKKMQRECFVKVSKARNALYLLAGCSMLGIFYLFSTWKGTVVKGIIMVLLGIIYAALGVWSLQKPFTSLLISLIIMLTFAAINAWAEFSSMFTTAGGAYLLVVQLILIYFLLQGVKGAFHADILEEEFKL